METNRRSVITGLFASLFGLFVPKTNASEKPTGYLRKVIRIKAEDTPNVKLPVSWEEDSKRFLEVIKNYLKDYTDPNMITKPRVL